MFDKIKTFPLETPALRPVEVFPVRGPQGQQLLAVRDPLGLIEGMAVLMPDPLLLLFMEMADGKTTPGEMAQRATMMTGQIIPAGLFEDVARQLDQALLLQSEAFVAALKAKHQSFLDSPVRPARVFQVPEGMDRLALLKELGDEFRRHRKLAGGPPERLDLPSGAVSAILAPHIDYNRGGAAYAWAYQALKDHGTGAKKFIVLGTCHRPTSRRFTATKKAFATPLGDVPCDAALLAEIEAEYGLPFYDDEFAHADEHTIELQAIYLKQMFPGEDIAMVPILVSSFDDLLEVPGTPKADEEVGRFTAALRKVMERHGDAVALVGGVDFSHCGPEFGDEEPNEPAVCQAVEQFDRAALAAVERLDAEAFFDAYRPEMNATKVCSIGTVYCVLDAMAGRGTGKLLAYQQSNSEDKNCMVSFAAAAVLKAGAEEKPKSRIILATR